MHTLQFVVLKMKVDVNTIQHCALPSGDLFSCHAIDNPSVESEMALLRSYGPDVPEEIMRHLVGAFGELRDLADQALIQYPYSTREVVNIIKHLQVRAISCYI